MPYYILSGMVVLGYISNYIPEYQFLLLLLFVVIAYQYYSYAKSEIAICTDEFEKEHKKNIRLHFFLSPKLSPFVGVLTIVYGVFAIWVGLRLIDGKSFINKHE